jgi:hypothetical protein
VKVLCPHCERLISLEVFRTEGAALIITCSKCGVESRVEPAQAAQSTEVAQVAQVASAPRAPSFAPRVSLASTEGASNVVVLRTAGHEAVQKAAKAADEAPFQLPEGVCPKCIAPKSPAASCPHCGILFESFDEATILLPKWLREAWVEQLRDWGNEAKHVQLRRKAQQLDALAMLGRLYRLRQAMVPEDPIAAEGRADVLKLAAGSISFRPPQDDELERRKKTVLIAILAVLAFLGLLAVLAMLARPHPV